MNDIKYVTGNILTPNTENDSVLVCHQVNCQGVMGSGLAKQVRQMHPKVYADYQEKCRQIKSGIGGLGDVQYCSVLHKAGYVIANIFGQDRYGRDKRYTDYDALRKAFSDIADVLPNWTVRIPHKMGCGLGGGDWTVVETIIRETLIAKGVSVEIWTYHA